MDERGTPSEKSDASELKGGDLRESEFLLGSERCLRLEQTPRIGSVAAKNASSGALGYFSGYWPERRRLGEGPP